MAPNHGVRRVVVGAHYGLRDWLAQRATAVLMTVFTLVVLVRLTASNTDPPVTWSVIFGDAWMKMLTFSTIVALMYHAWVGMRDVWMDYVKSVGVRLFLQCFTIAYLVGCTGWAIHILWRV